MADIKLYQIKSGIAQAKSVIDFKYEREIQKLCEQNLETFFGIRFLASEYSTGSKHKGRIDTLGIDENNCPVIIEYKLDSKENVINQGLFYLDWLMDHQADFELLCMRMNALKKGHEIDWTSPRLLCIAKDFTRYDDHAISQINRNIELIRYRKFQDDNIIFELASTVQKQEQSKTSSTNGVTKYRDMDDAINASSDELIELYQELEDYMFSLGDDVQKKELKYYHAFSRIKNFACVEIRSKKKEIILYLRLDYTTLINPASNLRDVSKIGHYGTGDTELILKSLSDMEESKSLIERSYNVS